MSRPLTAEGRAKMREALKPAFDLFDRDGSGEIECRELENVLRQFNSSTGAQGGDEKQTAAEFISKADKNADSKVSFDEFCDYMEKVAEQCEEL